MYVLDCTQQFTRSTALECTICVYMPYCQLYVNFIFLSTDILIWPFISITAGIESGASDAMICQHKDVCVGIAKVLC